MIYFVLAFISVTIFALVHLFAEKMSTMSLFLRNLILSIGGGVAIAFVFIDILPKLSVKETLVRESILKVFPYFEQHVYLMALLGFLLFFAVDRSQLLLRNQSVYFWLSLSSYALLNFFIGYAIVDKNNPEVRPLILFTFSIALLYFMNDYSLIEAHGEIYRKYGKWILIISLYLGWMVGAWMELSRVAIALVSAFIAGGVIMNVTRHRLLLNDPTSLFAFILASLAYACLLLALGS
jgi:hypothetical protein